MNIGYGFYLIFAILMVISVPWVFFMLPETKGIPLEKMDQLFDNKPVWRAGAITHAQIREENAANGAGVQSSRGATVARDDSSEDISDKDMA